MQLSVVFTKPYCTTIRKLHLYLKWSLTIEMKIKLICSILAFLVSTPMLAGGGWTHKKKSGFIKISQWWVVSNQHYTGTGSINPNVTRGIFNSSLYAEYGINDRLNAVLYLPFFSRATRSDEFSSTGDLAVPGQAINSIGDTDVAIKYGFIQGKQFVLSGTITLGLPLGISNGGVDGALQTGDGEFNQMLSFDLSTSLPIGKVNTYYTLNTGFNNRTNGFSDEFRFGVEAGVTFFNKLTTAFRLYAVQSLNNGSSTVSNGISIFSNNIEFTSFTTEIAYDVTQKFGFSANYGTAFSAKLILASPSYSFGVYMKF